MSEDRVNVRASVRPSRRAEYAEATRRAIVDAARRLFGEKGYFATKVDEIALAARVAPATVYAVTGGKQGLLKTLIDEWTTAPIVATYLESIERSEDPAEIVRIVASVSHNMRQEWGDLMHVVIATAPHDAAAAEGLETATARYRGGLGTAAERLADLDALREGVDATEALDILWFYFGYAGLFTLLEDNGWSYAKTERWLRDQAGHALLR